MLSAIRLSAWGSIDVHHEQITNLKRAYRCDNDCKTLHQDFQNVYIHLESTASLLLPPNKGSNLYQLTPPRSQFLDLVCHPRIS
jgi:hypothetical protein